MRISTTILAVSILAVACAKKESANSSELATATLVSQVETAQDRSVLDQIRLPEGFRIDYYAQDVTNARSMCLSPDGKTLYVGTRKEGNVYALRDTDGDMRADEKYTLLTDMNMPNGVALKDGDLYIAEVNRVLKIADIDARIADDMDYEVIRDDYPTETHHGWKYIAFGPDGKLYVPVGAPCNICESEDRIFNTITRIDVESGEREIVQEGVRNTVGFTWHPDTDELWFTDNGRDWMGDDSPSCELNRAPQDGLHYGYPYCHQGDMADPEFGAKRACDEFVAPYQNLGPHVAPLGLEFYEADQFPEEYHRAILIAEHGSWNRTDPIGYRISMVRQNDQGNSRGYEMFAEGWLVAGQKKPLGRPVDLEHLPDGSILISDDYAHCIYRVSYVGS